MKTPRTLAATARKARSSRAESSSCTVLSVAIRTWRRSRCIGKRAGLLFLMAVTVVGCRAGSAGDVPRLDEVPSGAAGGAADVPRLDDIPSGALIGDFQVLADPPGSRIITIRYTAGNACSPFLGIAEKVDGDGLRLYPASRPAKPGAVCVAVAELKQGQLCLPRPYSPAQLLHPVNVTFGPRTQD